MGTPAELESSVLDATSGRPPPSPANEDRTDGLGFWRFMAAGSVAGMVEHMAMFPVDTLKTRMQMLAASSPHHALVARFLVSIVRSEGPSGLYRGIAAMGLGAGPAHAVYFTVYELCKDRFGGNRDDDRHHPLIHAVSGVFATTASDAVLTPMDVVKQRLQLRRSPYGGVRDCVVRMLREEGVGAFYTSYRTTVIMNAPFTAVHFATYEAVKKILSGITPENSSEEQLLFHVIAGGAAGALASAITTPLDVVKTRLQCQSKDECEYLIELAKPRLKKSLVIDRKTGRGTESRIRTSTGMFLKRGQDPFIHAIEKRIANFTFIPVDHGEGLQILHYEVGQKYEPHVDYFVDKVNIKIGGQRIATVLMYLSDVEEGGETVFPSAKINVTSLPWHNELSECGKKGLSVKPKMGDALLFWSLKPDATTDPLSFHGGCPVIKGNKWLSTKWLHTRKYPIHLSH